MIREKLAKIFLHWKVYRFLSKKVYFQNLLGPEEMVLQLAQWLPEGLEDSHKKLHEVSHTQFYGKNWSIFLFTGKVAFFSEISLFNNLLGVKETS